MDAAKAGAVERAQLGEQMLGGAVKITARVEPEDVFAKTALGTGDEQPGFVEIAALSVGNVEARMQNQGRARAVVAEQEARGDLCLG